MDEIKKLEELKEYVDRPILSTEQEELIKEIVTRGMLNLERHHLYIEPYNM